MALLYSRLREFWCARRDSNLRRFAGVSGARGPQRACFSRDGVGSGSPAAEILSGAKDLAIKWLLRKHGAPGEIRTPDLLLRRQPLYPAELRAREKRTRSVYTAPACELNRDDVPGEPTIR
jgi:hypothetical protein